MKKPERKDRRQARELKIDPNIRYEDGKFIGTPEALGNLIGAVIQGEENAAKLKEEGERN